MGPDHSKLSEEEHLRAFEDALPPALQEVSATVARELEHMIEAIKVAVKTLPRNEPPSHTVVQASENTRQLYRLRQRDAQGVEHGSKAWREVMRRYRKAIGNSTREDTRSKIAAIVETILEAVAKHKTKGVFNELEKIWGTDRKGSWAQPTKGKNGKKFGSKKELLAEWRLLSQEKFSRPPHDTLKGEMPPLRTADRKVEPKDSDMNVCLMALGRSKAGGVDGIPSDFYQASPKAKGMLFDIVKRLWREEDVPEEMVEGLFAML
jgi:hypothetical protein